MEHSYVVIDVMEVYEEHELHENDRIDEDFIGNHYIIKCEKCENIRSINHTTYKKMIKHELLE